MQKTDALAESDFYQYDSLSRLLKHTDALANETSYSYDNHDQLLSVTDAQGNITTYEYDDFGRLTSQLSPATGITSYQYDNANNLTTSTNARNITTQYQYDHANRVTQINYPNSWEDIIFTYTSAGLLESAIHSSGQSQYFYNGFNEITQQTDSLSGHVFSIDYGYSANGKISLITYPDGTQIQYQYTNDRISNVTLSQNGSSTVLASNITYQPFGPLKQLTYGNGIQQSNTYDTAYQPVNITITDIQNDNYQHDEVGNISQIHSNQGVADTLDLDYDAIDRLTTADNTEYTSSYAYDNIGNRLTHTQNDDTNNYGYINNIRLSNITGSTTTLLQYDEAGNLIQKGNMLLSYNQDGQLRETNLSNNITYYTYNHLRQRVVKNLADNSQIFYQYLPDGRLLTETNASGSVYKYYVWIEQKLLAVMDKTLGSPTAQILYAHDNHINTVTKLSNNNGDIVWKAKYTPFGLANINEDADSDGISVKFNLRFAGQYYDAESGLHNNYHRYYDPETGRYITSDPIGLSGGINTYEYVGGNPISRFDPYGLEAWVNVSPNDKGGFDFTAHDDQGSTLITGSFNNDTINTNQIRPGVYSVSPRPKLPNTLTNWLFDRNEKAGFPTISNTDDWNTIEYPNGDITRGAQFHEGVNGSTFGSSQACLVSDRKTNNSLIEMFTKNYGKGGVKLYVHPANTQEQ